jgi:NAD(P)-dependent dehydrogenase (short-subunit alcohol dehydrogenase family)
MVVGGVELLLLAALTAAVLFYLVVGGRKLALAGRTIFITGCDSGYGFSLAIYAKEQGMRVVAGCYQAAEGEGRGILETLGVKVLPLDLSSEESIAAAADAVKKECAGAGMLI